MVHPNSQDMTNFEISLPELMKAFIEEQIVEGGYVPPVNIFKN
ncbi:MAG: hypothetical protein PUP90_20430 [Nostoc sp. S4]|nr:hypothetical protein [Nostoc sp. S4]